jgi:hypothetical protein|tara:strand:- start:1617 stop:1835 length:219 start_codon:yes stop_codon:yes gene_type:complete
MVVRKKQQTTKEKKMNENELVFDKLAELVFPDLDEAVDRELEMIMEEHGINTQLMVDLVESWFLKRAKQVEE